MEVDKPKGTCPCLEPEMFINDVGEEAVSPVLFMTNLALISVVIGRYQTQACLAGFSSFFIRRLH